MAAELQSQTVDGQNAPVVGASTNRMGALGGQQPVAGNDQYGAGTADDEVYSVADGRDRMTLNAWLSVRKQVNERTLRSFLRQLLLAVITLERSNYEHLDISPDNIVVHCHPWIQMEDNVCMEEDGRDDASRRNCLSIDGTRAREVYSIPPAIGETHITAAAAELNGSDLRENVQQRQDFAEEDGAGDVDGNDGNHGTIAAALRNRMALPRPGMVSSLIQTVIFVWGRGRFVDANTSTLLEQLLRYPDGFSSSLRSFLEYAKYLLITQSATASKLLRHDYLQCAEARLACHSSPFQSTIPINDVNEYESKLIAYYGTMPPRVHGLLDDDSSISVSATVLDELMPRTTLGIDYFSKSLMEANLSAERFVSVVAPPTASSSWVRKLACTQNSTLQRLDLSLARVPTSVLLQELAMLPRLTHLRLPRQILRDENLEHLVAAIVYADLLPCLRGLDENVRQAMDRLEKSYLMQLDMVMFLLQSTNPGANTRVSA
ncbi:hypothetical protein PsorP6_008781 [Peronosclerospora sorghi]|uniref:Uncharacterized protein n=1 Tax=Peronosclerospora sorghi TaxID=230839 RepID=A0ACC0VY08_9STRA|nr:hypothetical protein PsorP6_008781 [Peronosclerospora sorghi]